MGFPSPSETTPCSVAPFGQLAIDASVFCCNFASPIEKNGPIVCEAVGINFMDDWSPSASTFRRARQCQTDSREHIRLLLSANRTPKSNGLARLHRECC